MTADPDPANDDLAWFIAQVDDLKSKDWLTITEHIGQPVEYASDTARHIVTGKNRLISRADRERRIRVLLDAHDRIGMALGSLPETIRYNGEEFSLRLAATTAATHVVNGLLAGADLPSPQFAALTLPFKGYINVDERPSKVAVPQSL